MNFLAIIITLLLRQFLGSGDQVHRDDWFRRWQLRVSSFNIGAVGRLAMVILPALVVVGVCLWILWHV